MLIKAYVASLLLNDLFCVACEAGQTDRDQVLVCLVIVVVGDDALLVSYQ